MNLFKEVLKEKCISQSWKERLVKELTFMKDLVPQLKKIAQGREISGLADYVQKWLFLTTLNPSKSRGLK